MNRMMTSVLIVAILFCISISYAIDLESPGAKKVTVKSEIERGSDAVLKTYVDWDAPLIKVVLNIRHIFDENKRMGTDSPGFLLGALMAAWHTLDMRLQRSKEKVSQDEYNDVYEIAIIQFQGFRKLQKQMEIDDRTLIGIVGGKYDAFEPRIREWETKAKDAEEVKKPMAAFAQKSKDTAEPPIIAGKGWGKVSLGADRNDIESMIGAGEEPLRYNDVYFVNYPAKGIQISYVKDKDKLNAIFFYNKQRGEEHFATFQGKTDKGIDWNSSPEQVIKAYGKPKEDHKGKHEGVSMQRMVFDGIDFRFENGKMVRIGIPGE